MQLCKPTWLACCLALATANVAAADPHAESLRACLGSLDGIAWKLPYRPHVYVIACSSPAGAYGNGSKTAAGERRLELGAHLTPEPDSTHLSSDENTAALQAAMLRHFEALFISRGYRRTSVEFGDARTSRHPDTRLRGQRSASADEDEEKAAPKLPPIPYVLLARYVRREEGRNIGLTFKTAYANTWLITINDLAPADDQPEESRP